MRTNPLKRQTASLRLKGFAIVVVAAVMLELTSAVQYHYAREELKEEVRLRSESELRAKGFAMRHILATVEAAVDNHVWDAERLLDTPDSMYAVVRRVVEQNPDIIGSAISFIPDYYADKGRWYEPYAVRRDGGRIELMQLGSAGHDYTRLEFFAATLAGDTGLWTNPYLDDSGARMLLTTYAHPVRDKSGRTVAVLDADVPLGRIERVLNEQYLHPSTYSLMISATGQLMAYPADSCIMHCTLYDVAARDTAMLGVCRRMLAGESGYAVVTDGKGDKNHIFYAPVGGETGWSMAIVCADKEVFYDLRSMRLRLLLSSFAGLILLGFIIYRSARNIGRLQKINSEKERIGSELRIAREIQMGMLPRTALSGRDDVEILGSLTPAKEVGGDLYDFYIRDEKLYFCIGDVSGKGVPASLVMAVTRSLFRTTSAHETAPARIVADMNAAMADMNDANMFVTLFVGVLDLSAGRLCYCNAGHDAPVLLDGRIAPLSVTPNIPIGVMADYPYTGEELSLAGECDIFLYTDGLTEAKNDRREQFGEERVLAALSAGQSSCRTPADMLQYMTDTVARFVAGAEQSDDLTMLAVRYRRQPQRVCPQSRTLTLTNDIGLIPQLNAFVADFAENRIDASETMSLKLAVEEAVANAMNYAYPEGATGEIVVEAEAREGWLVFVISDSGAPFDPTAVPEADTSLPAEERTPGGLGIFLVRRLMDSVDYKRVADRNILTLSKKIKNK